ncbi:hypothetical protein [Crinalium epipsammum]|nr:hypothetical protein [Crinalium epipsammum]
MPTFDGSRTKPACATYQWYNHTSYILKSDRNGVYRLKINCWK